MDLSYFPTALIIEAINFMMPLALIAGLLCKNFRMALLVAFAFGFVGALQTYTSLMLDFKGVNSLVHVHALAKFINLVGMILVTFGFKRFINRKILLQAIASGDREDFTKARLLLATAGIITGIILYFLMPSLGVAVILGSFFRRPFFAFIAGAVWMLFYVAVIYVTLLYNFHANIWAGFNALIVMSWNDILISLMLPSLITLLKINTAKKLGPHFALPVTK